jgi:hypothetical protein
VNQEERSKIGQVIKLLKTLREKMDSNQMDMKIHREQMRAKMKAYREGMKAMKEALLGKMEEPTPEEMAKKVEHPEDSNEATGEETIGTTEDQSRDR